MAVHVPLMTAAGAGPQLYRWLGMFWTVLYQDKDFLRQVQGGRAMAAAQAYLNLLEAQAALDRRQVPVFHRERWYPLVIKRGAGAPLRLGVAPVPVLGPQTGSAYPAEAVFRLGGNADFANLVTYPITNPPLRVLTCITDNPAAPKLLLEKDKDFVIQDGVLGLRREHDPFAADSVFAVDGDETVVWACDAEFDWNYVYEHIGYVFGVRTEATAYLKDSINAIWDLATSGATPALVRAALAAMCGVPVCRTDKEVVEAVVAEAGDTLVITTANVYRLAPQARVLPQVVPGAVLELGQFLDGTVRMYAGVTDTDPVRVAAGVFGGTDLRTDIPVVTLPQGCLRSATDYGLSATWQQVPITYHGDDANGNPRLRFALVGTDADVDRFWADVWQTAEKRGLSLEACFAGLINATVVREEGAVWGYVEPLAYMLRNLIGANTILVAVDTAQLRPGIRQQLLPLYTRLFGGTLPAYTRLFLVEHQAVDVEAYALDTETSDSVTAKYAYAAVASEATEGGPGAGRMTFKDRKPQKRWVPVCKE